MLLQIETKFITYVTSVHADGPAHLDSLFGVYTVCKQTFCSIVASVDPAVHIRHKVSFCLEIMGSAWILMNISMYMYSMVA